MSSFASKTRRSLRRTGVLGENSPKSVPHGRTSKRWSKVFSRPRVCCDRAVSEDYVKWVDITEDENETHGDTDAATHVAPQPENGEHGPSEQELINILLGDLEVPNALWETKALAKFLSRRDDEALVAEDNQAWAWVDDREMSAGCSRDYSRSFDACGLQEILKQKRFGHPTLRNVDQRMIYISKLTPNFVTSLARTDLYHQLEALRDAIRKHVALESSLRVRVQIPGSNTYRLEFHMAHVILRQSPQTTDPTADNSIANLSFLDLTNADGQAVPHSIYQGHMSLVICGWSDFQWTGYAFTRDENSTKEVVESDELRRHTVSQYGFDFASPAQSVQPLDARRYWLRIIAHRSQYVLREWIYLVRTIEEGIKAWRSQDSCDSTAIQNSVLEEDIKKSLRKTTQIMELLRQLRDALSVTLRAYSRFVKSKGDRCYFSDITGCYTVQNSIFEASDGLADLLLRINGMDDSCKRFSIHLGRMINLENNRLIMQTNLLDQESNAHHAASNRLYERINELNEQNVVLTKEMRKLNEQSTEAACASQAEAMKTSRSTNMNLELLLLTAPLGMVLQYFSSVKEILFFKPSPTSFVLATLILMVLLRLLALAIQYGGTLLRPVFRKPFAHSTISQRQNSGHSSAIELQETRNV